MADEQITLLRLLEKWWIALKQRLKNWWTLDEEAETSSADNPLTPLSDAQRRDTTPLLTLAFGWGFLITGLLVGGGLGHDETPMTQPGFM